MGAGQSNELNASVEIELKVEKFGGEINEGLTEKFYITFGDQEKAMEDLLALLKKIKEKGETEYAHKIHANIFFPVGINAAIEDRLNKFKSKVSETETRNKLQALKLFELGQKVPKVQLKVVITSLDLVNIYALNGLINSLMTHADYIPSSLGNIPLKKTY